MRRGHPGIGQALRPPVHALAALGDESSHVVDRHAELVELLDQHVSAVDAGRVERQRLGLTELLIDRLEPGVGLLERLGVTLDALLVEGVALGNALHVLANGPHQDRHSTHRQASLSQPRHRDFTLEDALGHLRNRLAERADPGGSGKRIADDVAGERPRRVRRLVRRVAHPVDLGAQLARRVDRRRHVGITETFGGALSILQRRLGVSSSGVHLVELGAQPVELRRRLVASPDDQLDLVVVELVDVGELLGETTNLALGLRHPSAQDELAVLIGQLVELAGDIVDGCRRVILRRQLDVQLMAA